MRNCYKKYFCLPVSRCVVIVCVGAGVDSNFGDSVAGGMMDR
jgi:hypothetical protein